MKDKDWWIAGALVIVGLVCIVGASVGMRPMWLSMGSMMMWAMFVPWLVFIGLIVAVVWAGLWLVPKALNASSRHQCPACGARVHTDWRICPHCGVELTSTNQR